MPYRESIEPVEERRAELDAIVNKQGQVSFKTNNALLLRFKLHEALNAAKKLNIEPYASLNVKVSVKAPWVHILPRGEGLIIEVGELRDEKKFELEEYQIHDDETALGVLARVKVHSDALELHFPKFSDTIMPVQKWANKHGYEVTHDPETKILILKRSI
jgi:hypothetical protein